MTPVVLLVEMPQVADKLITYLGIEFIFSRALIIFIILRISLSPNAEFCSVRFKVQSNLP
jgi:hypothetical protein